MNRAARSKEIGYNLYMELLERAVAAMKSGKEPDLDRPMDAGPEVELHLPVLIPEDYVPDVHLRLVLYKRIASTPSREELDELKVEMIDRFGPLPDYAQSLFRATRLCCAPRNWGYARSTPARPAAISFSRKRTRSTRSGCSN